MRVTQLLNRLIPRASRLHQPSQSHSHSRTLATATLAGTMAHLTLSDPPTERQRAKHWTNNHGTGFANPWPSAKGPPTFSHIAKFSWQSMHIQKSEVKDPHAFLPMHKPDFTPPTEGVKATWLGHACVLAQFATDGGKNSINVLFDPVFSERCGPGGYLGPKRYTPVPCGNVDGLPEIDVVAISHNHYDHLDRSTLSELFAKQKRTPALLAPLNTWRVLDGISPKAKAVYREADWWETIDVDINVEGKGRLAFTCTPAQHMTARTAWDAAKSLWAGWAVQGDAGSVYFAGDTGYAAVETETYEIDPAVPVCPAFKEIGERFGGFDLAFLPIGAYAPRWFLSTVHCAPIDAVRLFQDVRAKKAMAIHWGTWDLSHEQLSEPATMLAEAREVVGLTKEQFDIIDLGASISSVSAAANARVPEQPKEAEAELARAVA